VSDEIEGGNIEMEEHKEDKRRFVNPCIDPHKPRKQL
jgi:hypothetical protein